MDGERVRAGAVFGIAERLGRILVVDDEAGIRQAMTRILRTAGFVHVVTADSVRSGLDAFAMEAPDLVIIDLGLPDGDGMLLLRQLRESIPPDDFLPLVVLTGNLTPEARDTALLTGATDFLTKPFDANEILLRIHNLLRTRVMHQELKHQRNRFREQSHERSRELEDARLEILERLARVAEHRDDGASGHLRRVGDLAGALAEHLGCSREFVDQLRRAAPLHDIGKIGIRDEILLKPGPLGPAEFQLQVQHTLIGGLILGGGGFPVLKLAEEIALTHHERWDGKGYPRGLKGDAIPLGGRIVAVADTFDALVEPRVYKPAWPVAEAMAELEKGKGTRFDPDVIAALWEVISRRGLESSGPREISA